MYEIGKTEDNPEVKGLTFPIQSSNNERMCYWF